LACLCLLSSVMILNSGTSEMFAKNKGSTSDQCVNFLQGNSEAANWTIWMPILMFDMVIFVLALQKTFGWLRHHNVPANNLGTRVMKTIMHDSVLYFAVILSLYCANAWTWGHAEAGIFQTTTVAINSSLASRMLLNIRKEGSADEAATMPTVSVRELSTIGHLPMQDGTIYTPHMRSMNSDEHGTLQTFGQSGVEFTVSMLEPTNWANPRSPPPLPSRSPPLISSRTETRSGTRVYAFGSAYPSSALIARTIDDSRK